MTASGSPYVGDVLAAAFDATQAVIVLLTPDDFAYLRPDLVKKEDSDYERNPTPQARPNVLFEAGMALGLHPDRTVIVEFGQLRPFSDIGGRHVLRFDGSPGARQALAVRLKAAGCEVDDKGTDWLTAGEFLPSNTGGASPPVASAGTNSDPAEATEEIEPQLHVKMSRTGDMRYRLVVTNRGPGPVKSLNLQPSEESPILLFDDEIPLEELEEGDSVTVPAALVSKLPRGQEILVQLSARLPSGAVLEKDFSCRV